MHHCTVRGYILLPVVLFITVIAAIAFLINNEGAINANTTAAGIEAEKVQQIAQAGLAHATWAAQASSCAGDLTLPVHPLDAGSYSATVTTPGGTTTPYSLSADQDAWFGSDIPTSNSGTNADMHLRMESGNLEYALYRFDLSTLPAGSQINSASAWLYVTSSGPGGGAFPEGPLTVHRVTTDWTETGATWDTMNTNYDSAVIATVLAQPQDDVWVQVNLTAQVQAWLNGGDPNFGIMLIPTGEGTHGKLVSREGVAAEQPRLDVVVGTGAASPLTITAIGTLTGNPTPANDTTRSLSRTAVASYQPASYSFLQLQPGSGKDTTLSGFDNSRNFGGDELRVSLASGSPRNALIQSDVAAIPVGARVLSAELQLYHTVTTTAGADDGATVHRVSRDWVEGTKTGSGTADGATWDDWDVSNAWTTAGGDYDPAAVTSSSITAATGDWESWDITTLAQGWLDGTFPNNGLLLKGSGTIDVRFASKENADPTLHPKLTITYACECGVACLMPQGSGNVLMAVINPVTLAPADAKKKALFESWGYTVEVIGESATQLTIDAAVSNNDVVYVSNTVNSIQLGGRLADVSIGVISEEGDYNPDFGTSSGAGWTSGSGIDVIDNSHYITALFPSGVLPIYAVDMEGLIATGTMATDLQTLANWGAAPGLAVVETGGLLADGSSTAAGPRVMLPIGRNGSFNWDYLNANGQLIVQRALQWGVGTLVLNGPLAHWKLDDAVGTIAVDSVGGHDGTLSGATWSSGIFDGALDFNGVSDYVDLGADPTLDNIFDSGATVTAWINPAGWGEGDFGRILDKADNLGGNQNGWAFEVYGSQQALFFQHGFSGGIGNFQTPTGSISLDTWQHVAVVFDNSSDFNDPILYIDGIAQTVTETSTPSGTRLSDSGITLTMGNYFIDFSRTFDGLLDDVRIYDYMLTDTEIADLAVQEGSCNGTFRDEFNAQSYSNNDGTQNWGGDWVETGEPTNPTGNDIQIENDISDFQLRLRNKNRTVTRLLDLSGFTGATFTFESRREALDGSSDYLVIEVTSDGSNWTEIGRLEGSANDSSYQPNSIDITGYTSNQAGIRFRTSSGNGKNDLFYIDNIEVCGN